MYEYEWRRSNCSRSNTRFVQLLALNNGEANRWKYRAQLLAGWLAYAKRAH